MDEELRDWDLPIETEKEGRQRNIPRKNYRLVGQTFRLALDFGEKYVLSLLDENTVLWGELGTAPCAYDYLCMRANEFVWMVTFMEDSKTNTTVVIDTLNNLTTVVWARGGVNKKTPELVMHEFQFGAIEKPGVEVGTQRHGFTDVLVGRKIAWHYSPVVNITHIYHTAYSIRSSMNEQEPLPDTATPEQRFEVEEREQRWGAVFFEEPARYVKINENLIMVAFTEHNRNRVERGQGRGDLIVLVDTDRVHDVGRTYGMQPDGTGKMGLITASGWFVDSDDPMDTAESPYWI